MERGTTMPKPADIVKIIDPPKQERKWCAATFIELNKQKRHGIFITDSEKRYCEEFIAAKITAPEEERGLIEDAIQKVNLENKQYLEAMY